MYRATGRRAARKERGWARGVGSPREGARGLPRGLKQGCLVWLDAPGELRDVHRWTV